MSGVRRGGHNIERVNDDDAEKRGRDLGSVKALLMIVIMMMLMMTMTMKKRT